MKKFTKSFTQQEPIPEAGIKTAVEVLRSGRLHRYNTIGEEKSEVALLEEEYSRYQGTPYCVATTSGGFSIQTALRVAGVEPGDKVLANAFTLAPVPGAIENVKGIPVFVEIDSNYHIDFEDLKQKAEKSQAKFLLLSLMRGHLPNMEELVKVCDYFGITMIEDCAHTMGASWNGRKSGNFGKVAAFSTQTYKHLNSGEGGFITTSDPVMAAKAIIHSGSYMLYERHGARPEPAVFEKVKWTTPNFSGRMDNLRASILRSQLPHLEEKIVDWNLRYQKMVDMLQTIKLIEIPERVSSESYVGSSIQFRVNIETAEIPNFIDRCLELGVELKWFGGSIPKGFTSRYDSWRYIDNLPNLPQTISVLENTIDMRIPLTFDLKDMEEIGEIIAFSLKG